jgi:hypothetical protein
MRAVRAVADQKRGEGDDRDGHEGDGGVDREGGEDSEGR